MNDHDKKTLAAIKACRMNHTFADTTGTFNLGDVRRVISQLEFELERLRELEAAAQDVYQHRADAYEISGDLEQIRYHQKVRKLGRYFPEQAYREFKAQEALSTGGICASCRQKLSIDDLSAEDIYCGECLQTGRATITQLDQKEASHP